MTKSAIGERKAENPVDLPRTQRMFTAAIFTGLLRQSHPPHTRCEYRQGSGEIHVHRHSHHKQPSGQIMIVLSNLEWPGPGHSI